jgi:hypothetical protein
VGRAVLWQLWPLLLLLLLLLLWLLLLWLLRGCRRRGLPAALVELCCMRQQRGDMAHAPGAA